jgi:hypothetical protein
MADTWQNRIKNRRNKKNILWQHLTVEFAFNIAHIYSCSAFRKKSVECISLIHAFTYSAKYKNESSFQLLPCYSTRAVFLTTFEVGVEGGRGVRRARGASVGCSLYIAIPIDATPS